MYDKEVNRISPAHDGERRPGMDRRVALVGRNPGFLDILKHARESTGITLACVYLEAGDRGVAQWTDSQGIPAHDLDTLATAAGIEALRRHAPDYLINFNAVQVLPGSLLAVPSRGCLNMHPGLLPEFAGLHTHQWAIREGASRFGATLHWMQPQVDAGDIALQEDFALDGRETGLSLYLKSMKTGKGLVLAAIDRIAAGEPLPARPQDLSRRRLYRHQDALDGTVRWHWRDEELLRFFRAADYGRFGCPTYQPHSYYKESPLYLHKAVPGRAVSAPPGTVVSGREEGLEVACGNGQSIWVTLHGPATPRPRAGERLGGEPVRTYGHSAMACRISQ